MKLDLQKLGASLMASAPLLMQLTGSKAAWWFGFCSLVAGPFLMAVGRKK